jgi:hypothetical protein
MLASAFSGRGESVDGNGFRGIAVLQDLWTIWKGEHWKSGAAQ